MKEEKALLNSEGLGSLIEIKEKKQFLPYVNVSSAEDYFKLDRSKREKHGFYLLPFSLPWSMDEDDDGWNAFDKEIKKLYPIQFFFRNTLYRFFSRKKHQIEYDLIYPIRTWFKNPNKRILKCIPRHRWVDRSSLVWDINAAIVLDFHEEMTKSCVDWDHSKEVREVRDWIIFAKDVILNEIPKMEHDIDCTHKIWNSKNGAACYEKVVAIEAGIEKLKTALIRDLAKYRDYLWT
jgi:hypothetical protein